LEQALNDPIIFERIFDEMQRQARVRQEEEQRLVLLNNKAMADPFDVEAQRKIEEQIRQANVHKNYEAAVEHHPEVFGRVVMLYIDVEINGHPVKAFVDSGAQMSIMSPDCAERCNLMKYLDERFQGIATGVGTAKILGRIHSTQIKVGSQFLPISLSIMEGKDVDLLFGLDVLKRHQAIIDLEKNCLRIHGEEVRFLPEHELPEKAREKVLPTTQEPEPVKQSSSAVPVPAVVPTPVPTPAPVQNKYPDPVIKSLTDLGVSREEAIAALDACDGNADLAANVLFQ
jgi:DNA damage-inducible protein 1